jgi:hypothetical protein
MALTGLAARLVLRKKEPRSLSESLVGGTLWLVMIEIFEFVMIVVIAGKAPAFVAGMRNLCRSELLPLVLLWMALLPSLVYLTMPGVRASKPQECSCSWPVLAAVWMIA